MVIVHFGPRHGHPIRLPERNVEGKIEASSGVAEGKGHLCSFADPNAPSGKCHQV